VCVCVCLLANIASAIPYPFENIVAMQYQHQQQLQPT
jgi:hypothetical protein